jgi:hypothetical protein
MEVTHDAIDLDLVAGKARLEAQVVEILKHFDLSLGQFHVASYRILPPLRRAGPNSSR